MIPPSTTITASGRRTRRLLIGLAAGIVGLNLVIALVEALAGDGAVAGPAGSTYVTTADGAAALAGTLERLGTEVVQNRTLLDERPLDPGSTLALIQIGEASYTPGEVEAVRSFVEGGGRLVVAGRAGVTAALPGGQPQWHSAGASSASLTVDEASLGPVHLSGFGSLEISPPNVAVLAGPDGRVVGAARPVGQGLVVWVADAAPFLNASLGRGETAAAVVALLGPGRSVVFDEYRHGFTEEGGLWEIIPPGWRTALILGGLTLLATIVAYGRRFGPPQDTHRRLPPDRSTYLEAVGGMMSRSGAVPDAVAVIRQEARRLLAQRSGPDGDVESAARQSGLSQDETAAVLGSDSDQSTLVAVDRALATLDQERR